MRLYKAVITDIPAAAKIRFEQLATNDGSPEEWGFTTWDEAETLVQDPEWKPEGWIEFIDDRATTDGWAIDCQRDEYLFFWPKISDAYRSISTAKAKAKLAERWGATVTIFEAEVSPFVPVAEMNALRKRRRDIARIAKLQARIDEIEGAV